MNIITYDWTGAALGSVEGEIIGVPTTTGSLELAVIRRSDGETVQAYIKPENGDGDELVAAE